jgi:hypothetical protein
VLDVAKVFGPLHPCFRQLHKDTLLTKSSGPDVAYLASAEIETASSPKKFIRMSASPSP